MSEPDKPVEPTPAEPENVTGKTDRIQLLRDKQANKVVKPVGKVPSLEREITYGYGQKIDAFDAEMERQLQEAMGGANEKDLYGMEEKPGRKPATGAEGGGKKKGKVYRIHGQDVFIDIPGGRSQGVLPLEQFPEGKPALGSEVEVHIEGFDRVNGVLLLTRQGSTVAVDWGTVAKGQIVEARVTGTNKGGFEVDVNGIRGFLPIGQVELFRIEDTAPYINQRLRCMVIEADKADNNLVVSRLAILENERAEKREKVWQEIEEGQVREGFVRNVRDFGAFIDLGGVDGLLPVSEISWTRTKDATTAIKPGEKVKVQVLKVDREKKKVLLGLRQLTASPWDGLFDKYNPGVTVSGKVTRLMDFGAFVELEPGLEGLIHISELANHRVFRVKDVVQVDQMVTVRVLNVDPEQRRISLSLKATLVPEPKPEAEEEEDDTPAVPLRERIRNFDLRGGLGNRGSNQIPGN